MYTIECTIRFEYGHRLLRHEGKCRHLHGHSGIAVLTVASPILDASGFVLDLGIVKDIARKWIDEHWDHAMLLSRDDPLVALLCDAGEHERLFLFESDPTAENMAQCLYETLALEGLPLRSVLIRETATGAAGYFETKTSLIEGDG